MVPARVPTAKTRNGFKQLLLGVAERGDQWVKAESGKGYLRKEKRYCKQDEASTELN